MKTDNRKFIMSSFVLATVFLWIGFVCSISFMEAWLKFRAPNVTLPIGLGIGRLVFSALNKVEWVLGAIAVSALVLDNQKPKFAKSMLLYIPITILVLQTSWLLPSLYERAEAIIQGMEVSPSSVHLSYIVLEVIKTFCLFILGICVIRSLAACREKK